MNDSLTQIIWRLSISLNLAKKRHEKDKTTKPWKITQRGTEEKRGARSSSTVEPLAGRGMGARRRTLARICAVRRCCEERANTLERLIVGLQCCGSERAVAGTQGRRATVAWSMLAELLKILVFQSAEHSDRKAKGFGYKNTREESPWRPLRSLSTSLFHFLLSCVLLAEYAPISWYRAQRAFIPKGATAERCTVVTVVPRLVGQADQRKTKNQP